MAEHIDPAQLSSGKRDSNTPPAAIDAHTGPRKAPQPGARVQGGSVGSAPFTPTPSLDPTNVKAIEHYAEWEGHLAPALNAFSTAHVGLTEIAKARALAEKNQAWNDYGKLLNVAAFAEKKWEQMNKTFDKARNDLMKAAQSLDESLSTPLVEQASAGNSIPSEIRAYVKGLSNEERMKFISAAMKEGDTKTLSACLGAPAYLCGLSSEIQKHFTRQYHEARSPDVVRRLNATRAAIKLIEERSGLVFDQVQKAMGGTWVKVKQLRQADSEAKKALLMQQNDVGAHDFLGG